MIEKNSKISAFSRCEANFCNPRSTLYGDKSREREIWARIDQKKFNEVEKLTRNLLWQCNRWCLQMTWWTHICWVTIWNVSVDGMNVNVGVRLISHMWEFSSARFDGKLKNHSLFSTHQNFECEPAIANALDVKEKLVCVRLRFVQRPRGAVVSRFNRDIPNNRNSHIRMCFQTKWNNRYANEKDGYYAHNLNMNTPKSRRESKLHGREREGMREWIKSRINF